MKLNWKVRFKNKVWLTSFVTLIISFVYSILGMFDIFPSFTKSDAVTAVNEFFMLLGILGVVVDPTTAGISDSNRAMTYEEPWKDEPNIDVEAPNG